MAFIFGWVKRIVVTLLVASLFAVGSPAHAIEGIPAFASQITINKDTSLTIREAIIYRTTEYHHGIFRYIPVTYVRDGLSYRAAISSVRVTDEEDQPIPFTLSQDNGNLVLKIGDPETTFTGTKTYILEYRVAHAIQKPAETGQPELYWDITGEGWQIPIATSAAFINSPHADIKRVACYSGVVGSDDQGCSWQQTSATTAVFSYPQEISYGSNLTVAIGLDPAGGLVFPSKLQLWLEQIWVNKGLLFLALPGLGMLWWWWHRGRDWAFSSWNVYNHEAGRPQERRWLLNGRHVPYVYAPIKELTPGEASVLLAESADTKAIVAELIELAHLKYIKIERTEKKKFFGKETDYIFTKLNKKPVGLAEHQQYLLDHLFSSGESVKLSKLKGTFLPHYTKMKDLLYKSLTSQGLFVQNPNHARGIAFAVGIVALVGAGFVLGDLLNRGVWWALIIYGISAVVTLLFAYWAPAKTAKGSNLALQVKGLQESIKVGAWREKIKEKDLFFEEVLPFAVALGVVDRLTKDMEALSVAAPSYVPVTATNTLHLSSMMHSFNTQVASSLSYNPQSSSYSSGSGFSGGSSGGGGGGGGGGSW